MADFFCLRRIGRKSLRNSRIESCVCLLEGGWGESWGGAWIRHGNGGRDNRYLLQQN